MYIVAHTSSIVSGRVEPKVSGKNMANTPAMRLEPPMIIKGVGPLMAAKSGAAIPPNCDATDAEPIAVFRMMVGYNSAVNKYFG